MKVNTLGRSERLKSKKCISALFETGSSLSVHPIRLIYILKSSPDNSPVKIGFTVPKKKFKRAIDRNLLKRRMREAYRLNKLLLEDNSQNNQLCLEIMLIYQGQELEDFNKISNCIKKLLKMLSQKIPE
jgi:ribonuclease P protein component